MFDFSLASCMAKDDMQSAWLKSPRRCTGSWKAWMTPHTGCPLARLARRFSKSLADWMGRTLQLPLWSLSLSFGSWASIGSLSGWQLKRLECPRPAGTQEHPTACKGEASSKPAKCRHSHTCARPACDLHASACLRMHPHASTLVMCVRDTPDLY